MISITKFSEKIGSLGSVIAAMGCAGCFPALGSLAASLGLGFLASYEGLFINTLLPIFAALALVANVFSWWQHKVHWRGLLSIIAPIVILLTLYPLWKYGWSTYLFYAALLLMVTVSILDVLVPPAKTTCRTSS